jgi:putative transcriptional regulator
MSVTHHPSDESLLRLASGALSAGPALVVSVHLETCPVCRDRLWQLEALGGALLEEMPPSELAVRAFHGTLARLDAVEAPKPREAAPRKQHDLGLELPRAMRDCEVGPWRWLGPRVHWSRVRLPGSPEANVMFIRGKAGVALPPHSHSGVEYMQVLSGALSDSRGQFLAGDLDEAGEEVDHRPIVDARSDCVCLAALDGDIRLHGILGRLLRPLVGF